MKKNKHTGSSFDDFLEEQGTLAETEAVAVKRVIAFQLNILEGRQFLGPLKTLIR